MAKLVAFYSRAGENYFGGKYVYVEKGNTEKVAEKIANITGADIFKIEQKEPYSENYEECINQAKKDLESGKRPALKSLPKDFEKYDEIYLGYPNYWGTMPMAVYTFTESFDWKGKTIRPFCTHEGSGLSNTLNDIKKAAVGAEVKKGLAVLGSRADTADKEIENWIKE